MSTKISNGECHFLLKGYFEDIIDEDRYKELRQNPNIIPFHANGNKFSDIDLLKIMDTGRNLEDWEIKEIIMFMIEDIMSMCSIEHDEMLCVFRRLMNCFTSVRTNDPYKPYDKGWIDEERFEQEFGFNIREDVSPHAYTYIWLLHLMTDKLDLTEYGTNIFCSYLTPWKGHYIRDIVNAWYEYYKEGDEPQQ